MRLICPNCSAQYEIDASLIPDEGRDVQCSNCGHTWFELPPGPPEFADAPEPEEIAPEAPEPSDAPDGDMPEVDAADDSPEQESVAETVADAEEEPEPDASGEIAASAEPADEPADDPADEPADEDDSEPSAAARAIAAASEEAGDESPDETPDDDPFAAAAAAGDGFRKRRPVDDEALDILREEADREMSQRRAPPSAPLETQTDLPLDEVRQRATPSRALRARMARSDGEEANPPKKNGKQDPRVTSADEGYVAPRRDLLPDIEEINSSLKSRKGGAATGAGTAAGQRRGFRAGFLLMVALAVLMIFAYAWAPAIASAMPSLEGPLLVYVDWANGIRDWIDALVGA